MQEDDSVKMQALDEIEQNIEDVAEDLIHKVTLEVASALRSGINSERFANLTRADIGELCSSDEFYALFYGMANKLVKGEA